MEEEGTVREENTKTSQCIKSDLNILNKLAIKILYFSVTANWDSRTMRVS